jgi:hypothetical protein
MAGTQEQWVERIEAWRASGASAAKFCEDRGYAASSLRYWSSRLKRERPSGAMRLARVEVVPATATAAAAQTAEIIVELRGARILVPASVDASALRTVIEALGGNR